MGDSLYQQISRNLGHPHQKEEKKKEIRGDCNIAAVISGEFLFCFSCFFFFLVRDRLNTLLYFQDQ